jgi:hypothetical protein
MSRQHCFGNRSHGNVEPPSSHPPQPTPTELLQMLAKSQRALAKSVSINVHQEPEPI